MDKELSGGGDDIKEFQRHTRGEKVYSVDEVRGGYHVVTTELGAFRLLLRFKRNWDDVGVESGNLWYVEI
jgi:hypothetical protein